MHLTLYLWTIGVCSLGILGINVLVQPDVSMLVLILWGLINPPAIILLDAVIATIIHHSFIPVKWFNPELKRYAVKQKELSFYRKLHINSWKDYIPETGKMTTGLSKGKIEGTKTDYLHLFLVETCYAEVIHIWMALIGFIPCFFAPAPILWTMVVPQAIVNFILNIPPILIQRNNRPKLMHMYERSLRNGASEKTDAE